MAMIKFKSKFSNKKPARQAEKTESSSQTWGQLVQPLAAAPQNLNKSTTTAVREGAIPEGLGIVGSAPTFVRPDIVSVSPQDTVVKIIRNGQDVQTALDSFGSISSLSCKAISNIAVIAASANGQATAVISPDTPNGSQNVNFASQVLSTLITSVPNVTEYALVAGSTSKTKEERRIALKESQKVDLTITMKSRYSEPLEFNNLKIPKMEADFVYNYFIEGEGDVLAQEDQSRDPLVQRRPYDVPRYVNLNWNSVSETEPLKESAPPSVRRQRSLELYSTPRGMSGLNSSNFRNSSEKNKKNISPVVRDGLTQEIVDIHNIEKGFAAIANDDMFPSTVVATFNISNKLATLIPVLSVVKK